MKESSTPFDDFLESGIKPTEKKTGGGIIARFVRGFLRIISTITLWLAISSAILVLALHILRLTTGFQPEISFGAEWFHWELKSAIPLILIGVSYSSLLFTLPRSGMHRFLGLLVGLAFVLWGTEQFLRNQAVIAMIDDVVVFLFVLDLSFVIRENLTVRAAAQKPKE